jgi:hypothetical protein
MALPFPARGRDKDQAGSLLYFQFTPGLFKADAFNYPGLFKFAPFRDLTKAATTTNKLANR